MTTDVMFIPTGTTGTATPAPAAPLVPIDITRIVNGCESNKAQNVKRLMGEISDPWQPTALFPQLCMQRRKKPQP